MIYEVLQYVNEHLGEKLTAEEVAERFGYSKWYFSTLFKRVAGTSFVSYVRRRRLYHAVCDILAGDKVIDVDFNDHGARYDYYQIMLGGIPNLADSMTALKKFVFEEKKYTLDEVVSALKSDYPDERMRLTFINHAPKFGNDIDEVDEIAVEITDFACDCLDRLSKEYGYSFHAQPFTFLWMVPHGEHTAATPDGRHAGENIAYSVSPMQGRDFNGFTAVLNSICKLPTRRTPGTTSAIVEVDPKLFTDSNIGVFADIMLAAADQGLENIQFNVVDAGTLVEAQKYPDKYNNLCVRVSGFSQKFNLLDKKLQDHIIGRTKHKCM